MNTRATAVVTKDGKLLLIHRINRGEEYYVLPGGMVEKNEPVEQSVLRELNEETSIEAVVKEKIGEFKAYRDGRLHVLFSCEYLSGDAHINEESEEFNRNNPDNFYEAIWVNIDQISNLVIGPPETKELLLKYLK